MEKGEMEEIKRHCGVVAEGLRGQMQLLAEGVATLDQKLNRFREEVAGEFQEMKSMIRFSYGNLTGELPPSSRGWRPSRNDWRASRRDRPEPVAPS